MQPPALEPGTWADWANAIATALAFTVALVLFVIGLRDRRRADRDRRLANEDHLRDQARRIWITVHHTRGSEIAPDQKMVSRVVWVIANTSDEAIINCRVGLLTAPRAEVAASAPDHPIVLPDTLNADGSTAVAEKVVHIHTPPPSLQLIFTDAAGVQWWRDTDGNLELWKRPDR
jgi:hypothetical protein